MNLKIKEEWLDYGIKCPFRNIDIQVRFIEKELYPLLYRKNYDFLFEIEKPKSFKQVEKLIEQKPSSDEINNSENLS